MQTFCRVKTVTEDRGVGLKGWLSGPRSKNAKADDHGEKLVGTDRNRLAVLPLANISPDPRDEYFADGLTEELITRLSEVPGLKVIARTSIMNYKQKEKSAREIGRELGVSSI